LVAIHPKVSLKASVSRHRQDSILSSADLLLLLLLYYGRLSNQPRSIFG